MKTNSIGELARFQPLIIKLIALSLFPLLLGCGSNQLPTHPVEGTVRFKDGSYPMFGDIEFYNAQHKLNARGKIQRDGSFTVGTFAENDGAVEGKHQIIVLQVSGDHLTRKLSNSIEHEHGVLINSSYFDYRTSGLECDIVPGNNPVKLTVGKYLRQTSDGMPKN